MRTDFPAIPQIHPHPNPLPEGEGASGVGICESPKDSLEKLSRGEFKHLNRSHVVGREHPDWRLGPCPVDRLWTVTLHYHEWAYHLAQADGETGGVNTEAAALLRHYVDDWIETCRLEAPGARELAWNAYAIATRIGWWIRSWQIINGSGITTKPEFRDRFLRSLWQQASYLRKHLEYDLRANHLLRDAVGLAWAGRFFDEPEARERSREAARIALEQASEQVLPDGSHFERSPMYHIHVMEDFLLLSLLLEEPDVRRVLQDVWRRMAEVLTWMRHPDGRIPLLNDAALNGACSPQDMLRAGTHIGVEVPEGPRQGGKLFPDFGLFTWHGDPWTVFFDVGKIGPKYQLGHGHADTLTVEASFRGNRILVDPGTWGYDMDARREYDRSTAAHNTVCVDGMNSSEVWHIFRCGRHAHPRNVHVQMDSSGFRAGGSHTGYSHLPGRPVLTRVVTLHDNGRLEVIDRCEGKGVHNLTGGWLLDPRWDAENAGSVWRVSNPKCGSVSIQVKGPQSLELSESPRWYHPEFGKELTTTRLQWVYQGLLPVEVTTIFAPA
ncbi:MAG: alginate lyase family protein [Pseudomonadota bacterium]